MPAAPIRRLWINGFLGYVSFGSMIQVMPDYVWSRFAGSAVAVGAAVTIGFLATMIARPIAGRLVDVRGARGIVMAGSAVSAVGGIAHLLAPNYPSLIAARLLLGLGEGALFTASIGWVLSDAPSDKRGKIAGRFGLSMWGGLTTGPIIGAVLKESAGFEAVWLMASILPVVGLVLAATTPRQTGKVAVDPARPRWFPIAARLPAASYLLSSIGYGVVAACLVPRLTALGLPERNLALAVFGAAFLVARFFGSPLVDRIGPRRMLGIALLIEASGLIGLGIASGATSVLGMTVLAGVGISLIYPCYIALVTNAASASERTTALGIVISAWDLGAAIGGPLGGFLAAHNYAEGFFAAGLCALLSMAVILAQPQRGTKSNESG